VSIIFRKKILIKVLQKKSRSIPVIFRSGALTPKLNPLFTDELGEFVALVELVATRYYSTSCFKHSST